MPYVAAGFSGTASNGRRYLVPLRSDDVLETRKVVMRRSCGEQRRHSTWPALRTVGNCVALPLAMTLALSAARNDRNDSASAGTSLSAELVRVGDALTSERPLPP